MFSKVKCYVLIVLVAAFTLNPTATAKEVRFEPNWESLRQHNEAPDWFRDAKFGIYFHWGVYAVPAFGSEWYPRNMHIKGRPEYKHHIEKYGDPTKFGYHDFVPMFKAEKFDADAWADLFVKAGARFAGPVAEHHDGFAMWASDVTPWNAGDMGPKRDIAGELAKAVRKRGMKFVTTFHHARNSLYRKDGGNWTGHYDHVKTDFPSLLEDERQAVLYGYMPRERFVKMWKAKLVEVIDKYQPDLMWFDSWLHEIPEQIRMEYLAYYFNKAAEWNKDVVVTFKQKDLPQDVGVLDLEKGRMDRMTDFYWLTDDTISLGSWCYTESLRIKPTRRVLHSLIDIAAKNGVLILNISPQADGTIPDEQKNVLVGMGEWLAVNGEAIYDTRTWHILGEGPTNKSMPKGRFGGVADPKGGYSAKDIRFTRSKDGDTVYAIAMGAPEESSQILIESFSTDRLKGDLKVTNVSVLGCREKIAFEQRQDGLLVTAPAKPVNDLAVVFKIETTGSAAFVAEEEAITLSAESAVLDGDKISTEDKYGRTNIGFWDDPAESVHWLVRIPQAGKYLVRGEFASVSGNSRLKLTVDDNELQFDIPNTDAWNKPTKTKIGPVKFARPGIYHLKLEPANPTTWKAANLWQIQLVPTH